MTREDLPYERRVLSLTDAQFEGIAQRAAEIVQQEIYASVGKSVLSKGIYVLGALLIALAAWLAGKGKINLSIFGG